MKTKMTLSILLAITMLFSMTFGCAEQFVETPEEPITQAEFEEIPATLRYTGGVVARGYFKGATALATDEPLEVAYVMTGMPYIVLGQPTTWEISISGGTAPYRCEVTLANQPDLSMDQFEDDWFVEDYFDVTGSSFDYTFQSAGRYFWQFDVYDATGQYMSFQTRCYEAYTTANEADSKTVAGKVNSLIDALITDDMSAYTRARVLHDWLIYNANYDLTYTHYDAAGVLLYGTGVCDSYARAYLMLCTAAGLECMYVSGTAGQEPDPAEWGNHGWNLVKLGDSWYHVDCTWDDPAPGDYENHEYFCVDDEKMEIDHRWNRPEDVFDEGGMLVPEATGGEYEPAVEAGVDYDFTFTTWPEYFQKFDAMVASGERRNETVGLYIGTGDVSAMYSEMGTYSQSKTNELYQKGLITGGGRGHYGTLFYYRPVWVNPTSYLRIDEESLRLGIGETATVVTAEMQPAEDVFTWTSSDPSVAKVTYAFSADGIVARITGVSAGEATITATSEDGISDSIHVQVYPPYQPDFALAAQKSGTGVKLTWDGIPGVTEYQIWRAVGSEETLVATTADTAYTLSASQLNQDFPQQLYIVARRVAAGKVAVTYTSESVTYGTLNVDFAAVIPGSTGVIEAEAFLGDVRLNSVCLPDGVTSIGSKAFSGCSSLTIVRIPDSVTSIGANAFTSCGLEYVIVTEGSYADNWFKTNFGDVIRIYE